MVAQEKPIWCVGLICRRKGMQYTTTSRQHGLIVDRISLILLSLVGTDPESRLRDAFTMFDEKNLGYLDET